MSDAGSFVPPPTEPVKLPRRYPPAPLVGVAAVVFNDDGHALLVKRGRPPRAGAWGLPGGLLDLGEKLVDGVRREVMEECAIEIEVGGLVAAFEPLQHDEDGRIEYHYVVLDYWARHVNGTPIAQDDADDVTWISMDDLDRFPLAADTRAVIRDAYAAWRAARVED
jgi:ADP-ribose pyrophosphatase YjhB (NUDIX family)